MILALAAALLATLPQTPPTTQEVADRYLELTFSQRYDTLTHLYAEDVMFGDPTADLFGAASSAVVSGSEALIALQKSWGLTGTDFEIDSRFIVGNLAVHQGTLHYSAGGDPTVHHLPFVNVLHIRDGRVTQRWDYGDYVSTFPGAVTARARDQTKETRAVAEAYLAAYTDQRHDDLASLLAPDVRFQDPTAQIFRAGGGQPKQGAEAVLAAMREGFAPVTRFGVEVEKAVFSNHHAIFLGTCTYTIQGAALGIQRESASFEHESVMIIEVLDGKVVTHLDYLDYSTFEDQLVAQMGSR